MKQKTRTFYKEKTFMFFAIFAALAMLAINLAVPEPKSEPDSVHPFVNTQISWEQTYHAGAWSGVDLGVER